MFQKMVQEMVRWGSDVKLGPLTFVDCQPHS